MHGQAGGRGEREADVAARQVPLHRPRHGSLRLEPGRRDRHPGGLLQPRQRAGSGEHLGPGHALGRGEPHLGAETFHKEHRLACAAIKCRTLGN